MPTRYTGRMATRNRRLQSFRARAILSLCLVFVACGPADEVSDPQAYDSLREDYGGAEAPEAPSNLGTGARCDDPHVVYFRNAEGRQHCSGVVLAPDLILTASHCTDYAGGDDASSLTVGVGGEGCRYGTSSIATVLKHPKASVGSGTDLKIVKLTTPLAGVSPVTLTVPKKGAKVTVSAFGMNLQDGQTQRCTNGTITEVSGKTVTVDTDKLQICEGDSGGAVFEEGTSRLVGIVSAGDGHFCSSTTWASADWDFVKNAGTDMTGAKTVSCTPGKTKSCLQAGATCPAEGYACQFGTSTCQESGTWGGCADNTVQTWDATSKTCKCLQSCAPGLVQNSSTCACEDQCGDGFCVLGQETLETCPADCNKCGNGLCNLSEDAQTCPQDCAPTSVCGNGQCETDETSTSCPSDCGGGSTCVCGWDCPPGTPGCNGYCGDGQCNLATENSTTCAADCGYCGDGTCATGESSYCTEDCGGGGSTCVCGWDCPPGTAGCDGYCGNGQCELPEENSTNCPQDCSVGGTGGSGGTGPDPEDLCNDPFDPFWEDTFGAAAWDAYMFYCGPSY